MVNTLPQNVNLNSEVLSEGGGASCNTEKIKTISASEIQSTITKYLKRHIKKELVQPNVISL